MKLISLNVALFEKNNDQLKKFINDQQADFLCLQEITRAIDSNCNPEFISQNTIDGVSNNLTYSFFAPRWVLSAFEKRNFHGQENFKVEFGGNIEFGNYTKSKHRIIKGQNIFVENHFSYVTDWSNWPDEDYCSVQVTDILVDQKPLRLINYHGIWTRDKLGNTKTFKACETIRDLGLSAPGAAIICGDFNLFPDTKSIEVLNRKFNNLSNEYQIKTTRPESNELNQQNRNVVDYIFVNDKVKVSDFAVLNSEVSDHLPLVLEFNLQ